MRRLVVLLVLGCATTTTTADPATAGAQPPGPAGAENAWVSAHNQYRGQHCATAVVWSDEVAKVAQAWADTLQKRGCQLEHSQGKYGENLAGGSAGALDPGSATKMWFDEIAKYDFASGGFSMETGHFTQVVWRETARIGCGRASCGDSEVFVCNYDPPGNVEGGYREQVKPPGCK